MKATAWLAAVAMFGAAAVYAPAYTVLAQDDTTEEAAEYTTAKEVMESLNELMKSFKNPRSPSPEELDTFFGQAWPRMAKYIADNPEANDHDTIYGTAGRWAGMGYGYGRAGYIEIARAYLKAKPDAKDIAAWEDALLFARLGVESESKAALAEVDAFEKAADKDAGKLLKVIDLRLRYAAKTEDEAGKAKLVKRLMTEEIFQKSEDEWVSRRVHRTVFSNHKAEIKDGEKFPDWADVMPVKDIDGKTISIADFKGKVVLLDFWAVWCGPCIAEMPNVIKLYNETKDRGFDVIGLSFDNEEGKFDLNAVRDTIAGKGRVGEMPWRQIYDGGGWSSGFAKYYGVNSIPKTVLIDADGVVVAQGLRGAALDKKVKELLDAMEATEK